MEEIRVGGKLTWLSGRPEGTFFEISETGPAWMFYYDSPTDGEIADVSEGSAFEIRTLLLKGVLWVFVRCGGQKWAEAPYNPHLSKSPELRPIESPTEGYALTVLMIDRTGDIVRHIRTIGLGNRFSRQLYRDVADLRAAPFDVRKYDAAIASAQTLYQTAQMVRLSDNYWRTK